MRVVLAMSPNLDGLEPSPSGGRRKYVPAGFGLGILPRTPTAHRPPDGNLHRASSDVRYEFTLVGGCYIIAPLLPNPNPCNWKTS